MTDNVCLDESPRIKSLKAENEWLWKEHRKMRDFIQLTAHRIMEIERD